MGRHKNELRAGQRFGRLTVIGEAGPDKWGSILWLCLAIAEIP